MKHVGNMKCNSGQWSFKASLNMIISNAIANGGVWDEGVNPFRLDPNTGTDVLQQSKVKYSIYCCILLISTHNFISPAYHVNCDLTVN